MTAWWVRTEPAARAILIAAVGGFLLGLTAAAAGRSPVPSERVGAVAQAIAAAVVAAAMALAVARVSAAWARARGYRPYRCRWARLRADESQRLLQGIRNGAEVAGLRVLWHDRWAGSIAEGVTAFGPVRLRLRTRGADTNDGGAELSISLRRFAWLRADRASTLWSFGDALVASTDVPVLADEDRPALSRHARNAWAATLDPPET